MYVSASLVYSVESRYVKLGLLEIYLKSHFKLSAFQLNLLLLSQISMCRHFGYLEVAFQSLIYKSIQIMSLCRNYQLNHLTNRSTIKHTCRFYFAAVTEICKLYNYYFSKFLIQNGYEKNLIYM